MATCWPAPKCRDGCSWMDCSSVVRGLMRKRRLCLSVAA